jgi:transcriptional regulator with XRE-family HTH domain
MPLNFGKLLKERRAENRLTLRDFAARAGIDPGNLSKIERGRMEPPQDPSILDRLCRALEYPDGDPRGDELRYVAAVQNGRIPSPLLTDEEVAARLPLLLQVVHVRHQEGLDIDRLVEAIRNA